MTTLSDTKISRMLVEHMFSSVGIKLISSAEFLYANATVHVVQIFLIWLMGQFRALTLVAYSKSQASNPSVLVLAH